MKARRLDDVRSCQAEIPPLPGMAPFAPLHCGKPATAHVWIEGLAGQDLCRDHVRALIRDLEAIEPEAGGPGPAPITPPPPDEPTIRAAVRAYLLAEFLPYENPAELTDNTPLVTGGILDTVDVAKVAGWLIERYGIRCQIRDRTAGRFDSIAAIARMVRERLAVRPDASPTGERGEEQAR